MVGFGVRVVYSNHRDKFEIMLKEFPGVWEDVVDIGCGQGELRRRCGKYIGVDGVGQADVVGVFPDLSVELERPETVVLSHVIEHMVDVRRGVGSAIALAKRWVVVCVPNPMSFNRRVEYLAGVVRKHRLPLSDDELVGVWHRWIYGVEEFRRFVRSFGVGVGKEVVVVPNRFRWLGRRLVGLTTMHYMCLLDKSCEND